MSNVTSQETVAGPDSTDTASSSHTDDNRWVTRFEELLKVKNVEDLKSELGKLAGDLQTEIQNFDLNAHLSPEAKSRLKLLEQRYSLVIRGVQKAQKQFDREFHKSLRVLKRTRQDAEKHFKTIKAKISKHRGTIVKASNQIKKKIQLKTKKSGVKKAGVKTARKSTKSAN